MKRYIKSIISLAIILTMNLVSYSQWTQSLGLDGGELHDVVVIDSLMFTVSPEGYIYSRNENEPWQINYDQGKFNRICKVGDCIIAYDLKDADHAIRSFDTGQTWESIENLDNVDDIVAIDSNLFFLNYYTCLHSTDYGSNIDTIDLPIFHNNTSIAAHDDVLYMSANNWVDTIWIFSSDDYGNTWDEISSDGLDNSYNITKFEKINGKLWVIADWNGTGMYRSKVYYFDENTDYWVNVNANLPELVVLNEVIEYQGSTFISVNHYPVYKFNYNELIWEELTEASHNVNNFLQFNNKLYAACDQGLSTIDTLGNFTNYYEGFSNRDISSIEIFDNKIYVAANNEIFVSEDNAVSFSQLPGVFGFEIEFGNNAWYCPSIHEFNVSYDNGINWQSFVTGLEVGVLKENKCFAKSSNNLFLGTKDGLYKSNINNISWNFVTDTSGFQNDVIDHIETLNNTVLLSAQVYELDLFYSLNNGVTFYRMVDESERWPIEVVDNNFYAFSYDSIFYTDNPSVEWNKIYFEPGKRICGFDRVEDTLIGVGDIRMWDPIEPFVYFSKDAGETWENIVDNLPYAGDAEYYESRVKLYDNLILFDNTNLGLWYRNDLLTEKKENSVTQTKKLDDITSPNPFVNSTKISFNLDEKSEVNLQIVNANGEVVESKLSIENSGKYEFVWDATSFPSGIYYYKITIDKITTFGKLIHVK